MSNNSSKTLFLFTLITGLLITISSNSWLGAWMGLEINLLSFIPLMTDNNNIYTSEASLKYFLIQALASASLLFLISSKTMIESMFSISNSMFTSTILLTPLFLKSGAAPLHWWFPSVMEGLSWFNCFILMTIQKIAPLILISHLITINTFLITIILSSVLIGSIGGYNQISIRKILTYSSINHMGWMLSAMLIGENLWIMYFMIYTILTITIILTILPSNISFINQTFLMTNNNKITKFMLFSALLSLGGLPPFLGFLPKWIIIQQLVLNKLLLMVSLMVILSLITLYYYLRLSYSAFMILNNEPSWIKNFSTNLMLSWMSILFCSISSMGLILCTILNNIL
nr:NADH dehydrogenase subunit 2 [Rhabdoblattella disparis]